MGTCSDRPSISAVGSTSAAWAANVSEYSKTKYNAASEYVGPKIAQAQRDYAPQLDIASQQYDIARMYANGWTNESVTDTSSIKFITEFEKQLPLRNISLTEYERRLKKLVTPFMQDKASVRMVRECFKRHWAFTDICEPESLTSELMFDPMFIVQEGSHEEIDEDAEEQPTPKEIDINDD